MPATAATSSCNICGCSDLGPGPGGRMSYDSVSPPRCTRCQSLERHRAFRAVFNLLKDEWFEHAAVLQFSTDRSNEPGWFASREVSEYEGINPLDLQDIDRPDDSYDIVVCNHVIEHVKDDRSAMRELARVCKAAGFVFLSFPDPLRLDATTDWGYPDTSQHGHYRLYGKDVRQKFKDELPGLHVFAVIGTDPCTGSTEALWLITQCPERARWIQLRVPRAERVDTGEHRDVQPKTRRSSIAAIASIAPNQPRKNSVAQRLLTPPGTLSLEFAPNDNMGASNPDRYLAVGLDAMRIIGSALDRPGTKVPASILDFACGWGRVARHLRASFPESRLVCADVWKDAVKFSASTFDAKPLHLSPDPHSYELSERFDLIWCGSLLTHLPEDRARRVLDLFCDALNPGGLAVFTTHGRCVRHRKAENLNAYNVSDASPAINSFDQGQYGFVPYADQDAYGFSLTPARWILDDIMRRPEITLLHLSERAWDDHQDAVAIQRRDHKATHCPVSIAD